MRERVTRLEASLQHVPADVHAMTKQIGLMQATLAELSAKISELARAKEVGEANKDSPLNSLTLAIHRLVEDREAGPTTKNADFADRALELAKWACVLAVLALGGAEVLGAIG